MKTKLPLAVLTALSLSPLPGTAQFEPYPGEEPEHVHSEVSVTFYSDAHFRGESITVPANTAFEDLSDIRFGSGRRVDNRISSVWIEGHAHVTLYDRDDFDGDFITLTESEADLDLVRKDRYGDWDNDASSLSVSTHGQAIACADGPMYPAPEPVVVHHPAPAPVVVVSCPIGCTHGPGSNCSRSRGHQDFRYGHAFGRDPAIIRQVERAYRDVLRRSPDRDGRRTYYYTMIERGWSESRLRKELRKSDEYHQKTIPAVVRKVYREELGRDPDPAGFQFYTQKMSRDGWYESHLRKALKRSPEYADRQRTPTRTPTREIRQPRSTPSVTTTRPINPTATRSSTRFTQVRVPTTQVRTPVTVTPRPVATPQPRRATPTPSPRPSQPKVSSRPTRTNPSVKKAPPPERTRPAPPHLN